MRFVSWNIRSMPGTAEELMYVMIGRKVEVLYSGNRMARKWCENDETERLADVVRQAARECSR